jgi:predicted component of type VI protein secretion system
MKVNQQVLDKIDNPTTRNTLGSKLRIGEQTIAVHLRRNKENGRMTKYDALQAMSEITGVPISEILEEGTILKETAS